MTRQMPGPRDGTRLPVTRTATGCLQRRSRSPRSVPAQPEGWPLTNTNASPGTPTRCSLGPTCAGCFRGCCIRLRPRRPLPHLPCGGGDSPGWSPEPLLLLPDGQRDLSHWLRPFCDVLSKAAGPGVCGRPTSPRGAFPARGDRAVGRRLLLPRRCFHTASILRSQGCFSLVLCIYIKRQSFVCFYYFNYCYKKPAIFNMWFGGGRSFVFLFGGFVCFFHLFVFAFPGRNLL